MKKKTHKSMALLLVVCMLITLFPATVFAANIPTPTGLRLGTAKIGNTSYASTFTELHVQWDEVEEWNGFYSFEIETTISVPNQNVRFTDRMSGSRVGPLASPFAFKHLNGSSFSYKVEDITVAFRDGNNKGPSATLNTDITVNQIESSERFTANYISTVSHSEEGYSYDEATFEIKGVPASHTVDFGCEDEKGSNTGSILYTSSNGVAIIRDTTSEQNGKKKWQMSLGDLEVNEGHSYYLDVYRILSLDQANNTAEISITRHPVDISFSSFDVAVGDLAYTGSTLNPAVTVRTVGDAPVTLTKGTHYTLSYEKNGAATPISEIKNAGSYTVVITGKEGTEYEGKTAKKTFSVEKAVPIYTVPVDLAATYGNALSDVALPSGFSWETAETTSVGNVGTGNFTVKYTPSDSENYKEVTGIAVTITVAKADQNVALSMSSPTGVLGLAPPKLNVIGGGGSGALTFVSSNPDAVSVEASTGELTIHTTGQAILSVSKAGDANHNPSSASNSVTLTVLDKLDVTARDTVALDANLANQLKNQGQIMVSDPVRLGLTNAFAVEVKGKKALATYAGGEDQQDEAKWIGLLIGNFRINDGSAEPVTNLYYKVSADVTVPENAYYRITSDTVPTYTPFRDADVDDSLLFGGTEDEFVLWVKSDVDRATTVWLASSEDGENEVKLTVNFTPYQPGPSSGGGKGGGGGAVVPQSGPVTPSTTTKGNTATISATVTATMDSRGNASISIPTETIAALIAAAKDEEDQSRTARIEFKVEMDGAAKSADITLPRSAFRSIAKDTDAGVRINAGLGTIDFDPQAVEAIAGSASSDISVRIQSVDKRSLTEEAQAAVGNRPVYDFSIVSGGSTISTFGGGTASVSIPYNPASGEDQNAIVVYYIDGGGKLQNIRGAYNGQTGMVDFTITHFSKYAVGYNKISFPDVSSNAWYADAVTFLAARGITAGTTAGTFSPDAAISRGEFLVMLMRAYGIKPSRADGDNFDDAGNAYYTDYLATAKQMGITQGVGDNLYQPAAKINRQDMFTLLYRALDKLGEAPMTVGSGTLSKFADGSSVAEYAKEAAEAFSSAGIISGSGGKIDPYGASTRAQMARILTNLLKE